MFELGSALNRMASGQHLLAEQIGNPDAFLKRQSFGSPQPAEAHESVSRVFFPHKVIVHGRAPSLDFTHSSVSLGDVSLNQIAYGADVEVRVDDLMRDRFVLVLALAGEATVGFDEHEAAFNPGDCVLMSPNVRYRFEMSANHRHLAIGMPCDRLVGSGKPLGHVHSVAGQAGSATRSGIAGLVSYLDYVCGELQGGNPLFTLSSVVSASEANLVALVRAALFDGETAGARSGVLPGFVRRADRFIAANLCEDIRLEDIVAAAGVPARTLYHGFDRFVGHSPMRWLRIQRMEAARADILASSGDLSITDLACRYWIGHGGRFASFYRELYGESPSETLARVHGRSVSNSAGSRYRLQ